MNDDKLERYAWAWYLFDYDLWNLGLRVYDCATAMTKEYDLCYYWYVLCLARDANRPDFEEELISGDDILTKYYNDGIEDTIERRREDIDKEEERVQKVISDKLLLCNEKKIPCAICGKHDGDEFTIKKSWANTATTDMPIPDDALVHIKCND